MKRVFIGFVVLFLLFGCLTERKIQRCQKSSVVIQINNNSGTGIVIGPNRVLTVAHVLDGEMSILGKPVEMLKLDKENDLLLLKTEHTFKHWLKLAEELPKLGEEVFIIGHIWNKPDEKMLQHLTFGRVAKKENNYIYVDGKMVPGFSGAPIINESGEVVAIAQWLSFYIFPSPLPMLPGQIIDLFAIGKNSLVIKEFLNAS